jgi:hypothetical protein
MLAVAPLSLTVSRQKMHVTCAVVAALLGLGAAASAQAPTIPLPSDLRIDAPAVDVPASVARFAGAWAHGAWDGVLPHVLVVETVDGSGRAQVVYGLGDSAEADVTRGYWRATGRIVGDLLTFDLSEGASVAYHIDGNSLRGTYASRRSHYTVMLMRATLAEVRAVPASVPGVVAGTTVRVPMTEPGPGGKPGTLEATLYRPAGKVRTRYCSSTTAPLEVERSRSQSRCVRVARRSSSSSVDSRCLRRCGGAAGPPTARTRSTRERARQTF